MVTRGNGTCAIPHRSVDNLWNVHVIMSPFGARLCLLNRSTSYVHARGDGVNHYFQHIMCYLTWGSSQLMSRF